jgi:hypothetical protein
MQQRYYDPVVGRFLSVDPVGVFTADGKNFNRYWYADNNPYRYIDPDGRCTGSRIKNTDGTCASGGGDSVGIAGDGGMTQNMQVANAASKIVSATNLAANSIEADKAQNGGGFFRGAGSFFRGLSRYARHERRVMGWAGAGEAVQANTVEKTLLGEALGIALHANQTSIKAGGNRLLANGENIAGRQLMSLLGGAALGGGGAAPSLAIVAGMGDVYFGIESLALELNLNISTIDHKRPILPQISDDATRNYAEQKLGQCI